MKKETDHSLTQALFIAALLFSSLGLFFINEKVSQAVANKKLFLSADRLLLSADRELGTEPTVIKPANPQPNRRVAGKKNSRARLRP